MIHKSLSIIALICLFSGTPVSANIIPEEIILAIQTGNSKELANYFNDNIELVILDEEDVYSRHQAEQIMKNYFTRNVPQSFTILHEGGKDGSHYAIGNLVTNQGEYRIYFLTKQKGDRLLIHQLRIEEKDDN
ncbi:MAG: DUF4783 domain-containing protein [Bacteroidota bacterium]